MAGETIITVVGNLTADPELRYTQNGLPVANFTIASTPRTFARIQQPSSQGYYWRWNRGSRMDPRPETPAGGAWPTI